VNQPLKEPVGPPIDLGVRDVEVVYLAIVGDELRERNPVLAAKRLKGASHDLHVLLRHRPRSISRFIALSMQSGTLAST